MKISRTFLVLVLIFILFFIGQYLNITRLGDDLVAHDPYYHKRISDLYVIQGNHIKDIPNSAVETPIAYTSLTHPLAAIISLVTGLNTLRIYQVGGTFLLFLISLMIFLIVRRQTKRDSFAVLGVVIFLSFNYLLTRMSMLLPENFALLFMAILIFLVFVRADKNLIIVILTTYLFYHQRSIILPLLFFVIYFVLNKKDLFLDKKLFFRNLLFTTLLVSLLSLPVLIELAPSYFFLAKSFLGINQDWGVIALDRSVYQAFGLNDLNTYLNPLVLVLILFAFSGLKEREAKRKEILVSGTMVVLLLVLSLSTLVASNIPSSRLVIYSSVFISIFAPIGFNVINKNINILVFLLTVLVCLMALNLFSEHGWSGVSGADKETINYIKVHQGSSVVVSYGTFYYTFLDNAEWDPEFPLQVFRQDDRKEVLYLLKNRYGDRKVILAITSSGFNLLSKDNPSIFEVLQDDQIFETWNTKVYQIDLAREK